MALSKHPNVLRVRGEWIQGKIEQSVLVHSGES